MLIFIKFKSIKNWNVSKGKEFTAMFLGCTSLIDLKALEKWKVSEEGDIENFKSMLLKCSSAKNLEDSEQLSSENSDDSSKYNSEYSDSVNFWDYMLS